MVKIAVKNLEGKSVETLEISDVVFGIKKINNDLVSQVYNAQYANKRKTTAHTKTRGEVRGSTKKPWKQKGTGRARTGSVKNPIWRSGGTIFGPSNKRNYVQKINKKMSRLAIMMVLSSKVMNKELILVDDFKNMNSKTKKIASALSKLDINGKKVFAFTKDSKKHQLATRNLENSKNSNVDRLSVLDLLNFKYLITDIAGIKHLEKKYSNQQ